MVEWTDEDGEAASAEGWDVWDCPGSDNGPWQLCRFDDPSACGWPEGKPYPFADDNEVWEHVATRAEEGSALHQRALDFLAEHNPLEAAAIQDWMNERNRTT